MDKGIRVAHKISLCATLLVAVGLTAAAQGLRGTDSYFLHAMLRQAYDTVRRHYYDAALRGLDWDARFREYDDKLKSAASLGDGLAEIEQFLDGLHDSHTFFQPPSSSVKVDYGYEIGLIGEEAFITHVRPGTDAASKVSPGDRIVSLSGYHIDRTGFHRMQDLLYLSPRASTELALVDTAGHERTVVVNSTVKPTRITRSLTNGNEIGDLIQQQEDSHLRLIRQRYAEIGDVMIWKMPGFLVENGEIDQMFGLVRKHAALILDLRGNYGGFVTAMSRMVGNLFDHDVPVGTRVTRDSTIPLTAAARGREAYRGKLVVLIDSDSASAAEIFARVIQLEGRGAVVGDHSAGLVMEALRYAFPLGNDQVKFYAFSVTDANLLMRDGSSLEHVGVTPDDVRLPSAQDLASNRDPALARAAELVGLTLDAVAAGRLFPFEWRPF